jgi:hypothetical protein
MIASIRRIAFSQAVAVSIGIAGLGMAHQAAAFCFSNDSLSNTSMEVKQIETGPFLKAMNKALNTACRGVSTGETKSCNE